MSYVADKMETAIEETWMAARGIDLYVPEDLMWKHPMDGKKYQVRQLLKQNLRHVLRYQLVSYLALHDMTDVVARYHQEEQMIDRILGMSQEQLREWFGRIYDSGEINPS